MKKIIVNCPKCKNKMRILNKRAKYRCPSCKEIYNFTWYRKIIKGVTGFFTGIFTTIRDIKNGIVTKYRNMKSTYKYLREFQKNNPNWKEHFKKMKKRG